MLLLVACRGLVSLYEAVAAELTKFIQGVRAEWHEEVTRSTVMQQLACSLLNRRNILETAFSSQLGKISVALQHEGDVTPPLVRWRRKRDHRVSTRGHR